MPLYTTNPNKIEPDKKYCHYWGCKTEPKINYGGDLFGFSIDFDLCTEHYNYLMSLKDKDPRDINHHLFKDLGL